MLYTKKKSNGSDTLGENLTLHTFHKGGSRYYALKSPLFGESVLPNSFYCIALFALVNPSSPI